MTIPTPSADKPALQQVRAIFALGPGVLLAAAVAAFATAAAPYVNRVLPIPSIMLALLAGIALNSVATRPIFRDGIVFCVKTLLRFAVAFLGLRIAFGEIVALGLATALLVIGCMAVTMIAGALMARALGQSKAFGALAGAGTAVCGASATLATSAVLPNYPGKEADVSFVVVAVNTLSTVAMVVYPLICKWLGFDDHTAGVMLGATIHDVAQVVGAGYSVSEVTGNTAVIVKLFRVFLLLPVVLAISFRFGRTGVQPAEKARIPDFALVFLGLCIINSLMPALPSFEPAYRAIKAVLNEVSSDALLTAIAALGLGTSLSAIAALGWRHLVTITGTTVVLLITATGALLLIR